MTADGEVFDNIQEYGCECAQVLIVDDIDMNRYMISEIIRQNFALTSD